MKITIKNLEITKGGSYSHSDRPCVRGETFYNGFPDYYQVWLGSYRIAQIWKTDQENFVVENIHESKFKSLNHAIKGIYRRLQGRTVRW